VVAVAHHQPPAALIDLVGERLDIGDDVGLQRRRKHLPRPSRTISSSSDKLTVFSLDASASETAPFASKNNCAILRSKAQASLGALRRCAAPAAGYIKR
jgi:hypothetical protein